MGEPKCLFFVLLIWCLGTVHAQDSRQSCPKPQLKQGYFGSDEEMYQHGTELYYACDKGWKPAVEGWWAMVECENRKWSHTPQCIDENNCIAPDNPNAKVTTPGVNGWYPNGKLVRFECDETYEIKGPITATCENGTWTTLPLCEEENVLCGQPPPVTNAVITREYREKFQEGSKINYKCRDSYTYEGTDSSVCQSGDWTTSPKCIQTPFSTERASTGEGGSSTSSDRGNGGTSSGGDHSTSSGGGHSTSSGGGHSRSSGGGHSTSSAGGRSTSSAGGHSTSSGDEASANVRPSARPQPGGPFLPVDRCGEKPTVDNGDFISDSDRNRMALTFTCINYYKLVGPEQVMCHNDQTWSELPICKAPCTIDKRTFYTLDLPKDMFVKEGESQTFLCKKTDSWGRPFVADVRCQNGQGAIGRCALGCKLDTWNYHWLDLTQDMFVKEGRQTWNCKQTDYRGRRLVANVECHEGYLTVRNCSL
ncbi:complement factor H-related protein 1-like isoform X2 [Oncorhynchus keta]|uniref:complement factor H-related protein 1-like isoform X2 n=1 Tax=Oncorhynchus keta TaxID=8018 RepID=UPI0015FA0FC7|nr:complement factor H-related protein 1-like isoform X2 [Oncorhynchus keta]